MKKITITAMMLVLGISMSYGAQITWRQNTTPFTKDGSALDGNAVLLVLSDNATPSFTWENNSLSIPSGATYLGKSALADTGIMANVVLPVTGDWSSGTLEVAGGAAFGEDATVDAADINYGANNKHDYYMVIFDSDTISGSSKYTLASLTGKNAASKTGALTLSFAGADLSNATWTAVPEPTTVALLALGLAAVGLKRKVA